MTAFKFPAATSLGLGGARARAVGTHEAHVVKREAVGAGWIEVPLLLSVFGVLESTGVCNEYLVAVQVGDNQLGGVVLAQGGQNSNLERAVVRY